MCAYHPKNSQHASPPQHVANESVLGDNLVPHIATTQQHTKELHDPLVGRYYRRFRKNRVRHSPQPCMKHVLALGRGLFKCF